MAASVKVDQKVPKPRCRYRVTNWPEYDCALVNPGNLTIWFDEGTIKDAWNPPPPVWRGKPGLYSAEAIQACRTLKTLLRLPYRATGIARTRTHSAHLLHAALKEAFNLVAAKSQP
jgi:hypothetical protein